MPNNVDVCSGICDLRRLSHSSMPLREQSPHTSVSPDRTSLSVSIGVFLML
jgi:hypothetical protein